MTTQNLLTLLNSYLKEENYLILNELRQGLEQNIMTEFNKTTRPSLARSMNKILKKAQELPSKSAHYAFMNDAWLTVLDGYKVIQTKQPIKLEMVSEGTDTLKVSEKLWQAGSLTDNYAVLPSRAELKAFIKIKKAEGKKQDTICYFIKEETEKQIVFNAEYLLTIMEAADFTSVRYTTASAPAYFDKTDGTRAILLPIRIAK